MTETPTASYPDTRLLIAGQWRDAADGRRIPVANPATGQTIGHVAHANVSDLDDALAAAQKGFEAWRSIPAAERAATMRKAAGLLRERADAIARVMVQE
ncbi:MAG TPA: aldehyde dehydrogenase family protein, partial [Burkholderiaceae bacterium]